MSIKPVAFLALFVLIPVVSLAGFSGGGGGMGLEDGLFWGADLDRNERLDPNEAKLVHNLSDKAVFSRYDENGNGSISRVEFSEFMQQSPWTDRFIHPADTK